MLSKEICKKCFLEQVNQDPTRELSEAEIDFLWGQHKEKYWAERKHICLFTESLAFRPTKDIPENCVYSLEQAIYAGVNINSAGNCE